MHAGAGVVGGSAAVISGGDMVASAGVVGRSAAVMFGGDMVSPHVELARQDRERMTQLCHHGRDTVRGAPTPAHPVAILGNTTAALTAGSSTFDSGVICASMDPVEAVLEERPAPDVDPHIIWCENSLVSTAELLERDHSNILSAELDGNSSGRRVGGNGASDNLSRCKRLGAGCDSDSEVAPLLISDDDIDSGLDDYDDASSCSSHWEEEEGCCEPTVAPTLVLDTAINSTPSIDCPGPDNPTSSELNQFNTTDGKLPLQRSWLKMDTDHIIPRLRSFWMQIRQDAPPIKLHQATIDRLSYIHHGWVDDPYAVRISVGGSGAVRRWRWETKPLQPGLPLSSSWTPQVTRPLEAASLDPS